MVAIAGVEAALSQKKGAARKSGPFSFLIGGAEGDRTPDLMTASHALSQLSYSPENRNAT